MSKKPKWRIGDRVRLTEAWRFVRCGYPLCLPNVAEDILENRIEPLKAALKAFGITTTVNDRVYSRLASAFAYAEIQAKGFGGKLRSIHEEPFEARTHLVDRVIPVLEREFVIIDKFQVMTGEYYGPYSGRAYEGEYDYEPGGLDKAKSNTILVLTPHWRGSLHVEDDGPIERRTALQYYDCVWDIRVTPIPPTTSPNSE